MRFLFLALSASLVPFSPVTAETPSFDCARAESAAEKAVCADPALAALDREMARIYKLAATDPNLSPEGLSMLKAMQRGWIKGRDECWKSDLGVPACTAQEYAFRFYELRQGSAAAPSGDGDGLTTGPVPFVCDGLDAILGAAFVSGDMPMVVPRWGENAVVLDGRPAGSGAAYEGERWGEPAQFWTKDDTALFTPPGGLELNCTLDKAG